MVTLQLPPFEYLPVELILHSSYSLLKLLWLEQFVSSTLHRVQIVTLRKVLVKLWTALLKATESYIYSFRVNKDTKVVLNQDPTESEFDTYAYLFWHFS